MQAFYSTSIELRCGYLLLPDSADWLSRFYVTDELRSNQDTSLTKIDILVANVSQQNPSPSFAYIGRSVVHNMRRREAQG